MKTAKVELPPKLLPVFSPARGAMRYRGAKGGRGSGKSFTFAKMAAIWGLIEPLRILCTRELQVSIKQSFHAELKNAIASEPWLAAAYDVGENYLRGYNGTVFMFYGLRHNMSNIKSMSQIDLCIVEECEDIPESSWIDLEPTIRSPKSEIWCIWNPKKDGSPIDNRLVKTAPPRSIVADVNYSDNPWFPPELEELRQTQLERMEPSMYQHIWYGAYLKHSKAQIFSGKYRQLEFIPGQDWDGPYFGIDWGFSQDPTTGVKCWIYNEDLYIEYDGGKVGLELDDTPDFLRRYIPDIDKYDSYADCARPESISHVKRRGMQRVKSVSKWNGSVEDGIEHIKSYSNVFIHPRCKGTMNEFEKYSYKVDRLSGDILPLIVDADNHYIDAIRYALSPMIRRGGFVFAC